MSRSGLSGLDYLASVDQLLVKQKVELLEAITGFETANQYSVLNSLGQKVFTAVEDTDCCTRNCCGPKRPFAMHLVDSRGVPVLNMYRPLRCASCWFPCCLQKIEIYSTARGDLLGSIVQNWSVFRPQFSVKNSVGETVLKIVGPFCTFSICGSDVEFRILSRDGRVQVGRIAKQWSGLVREAFTDSDNFGISFPQDLDLPIKATLLGATFLIDFMFFEKRGNKEQDRPGMFNH